MLELLKFHWYEHDYTMFSLCHRPVSPIDGTPFENLTNMKIRHSYDFTTNTSPAKIHWMEVYFLPGDADTVNRLSARELSQMTSSVAKACMGALSPHLCTLVELGNTNIGLRINLEPDKVRLYSISLSVISYDCKFISCEKGKRMIYD